MDTLCFKEPKAPAHQNRCFNGVELNGFGCQRGVRFYCEEISMRVVRKHKNLVSWFPHFVGFTFSHGLVLKHTLKVSRHDGTQEKNPFWHACHRLRTPMDTDNSGRDNS